MVLRSWPVRRAMAETDRPCRARSRIMTSSPRVTTGCSQNARGHPGAWPALPGPRGSPPGPGSGAELRNFQPALPGRIPPAPPALSATAVRVLFEAGQHALRLATPPKHLPAAACNAVLRSLLKGGCVEECPAPFEHVGLGWRQQDGAWTALRVTVAGLLAIGASPPAAPVEAHSAPPTASAG